MLTIENNLLKRGLVLSVLTMMMTGCMNLQSPQPTAVSNIPTHFDTQAQGQSAAAQNYSSFFADTRLLHVIELALDHNRDLRSAVLNIQKVQQQYQITRNEQLPQIGASSSVIRQVDANVNQNNPFSSYQVNVGMSAYELDFWGRIQSLKDAALNQYLVSQNQRDAVQISLIAQVAQAWVSYSFAHAQLELAEQTAQTQLESFQLNKKRFQAGIDSEIPLRQAEMTLETSKQDIAHFRTEVMQAKNLLNVLVGQPVPDALLASKPIRNISQHTMISVGIPSDLLSDRPDLKAAEYQLRAAGANIGAAKARLYPNISLTASTGFASTELKNLFKSGAFQWSVGPSIDLPIFDWGTRKANVKISQIDQELALAQYEKSIQTAFKEVNDALVTQNHIQDRLDAQTRLISATSKTTTLSNQRFRAGIDSYLSVLDAQRTSYAAQQNLLLLEQAKINNQIELYRALGGGLDKKQSQLINRILRLRPCRLL